MSAERLLLETVFIQALLNRRGQYHPQARAFADSEHILVLNDLRLTMDDAAQIDHLIIHPLGLILVASKSVTGNVAINARRVDAPLSGRGARHGLADPASRPAARLPIV